MNPLIPSPIKTTSPSLSFHHLPTLASYSLTETISQAELRSALDLLTETAKMPASSLTIVSKCTVYPGTKSSIESLKLSVSDLPMLSCHYIQKGLLFNRPPLPIDSLLTLLKSGLSQTLTHFPALAGRLMTDSNGFVHISCNDAGADFIHANMAPLCIRDVLSPTHVPESVKEFFAFTNTVSYEGHFKPILAVQVTELADGVFIGCAVNHSVTDGTSFWNFFNSFAEICRGAETISKLPDFRRNFVKDSMAVIRFPEGTPKVTFDENAPLKERIFRFNREAIRKLKSRANAPLKKNGFIVEYPSKKLIDELLSDNNDPWANNDDENQNPNGMMKSSVLEKRLLLKHHHHHHHHGLDAAAAAAATAVTGGGEGGTETTIVDPTVEISSFQSLSAQLWRSVTRARKLPPSKMATFRMAVNCRQRLEPKIDPLYFGNAIQSIPTVASVGDVLSRDLRWCAAELNKNVIAHDDAKVRRCVDDWEKNPRCFPLGNLDGASMTMGSSPRFPMYDNDFGWGRPLAVRSGRANKFDGKISAFPGRDGDGSVDLEVCLAPETMAGLENDWEFMQYVVQD